MSYDKYKTRWLQRYPAVSDLKKKAKKRIPSLAWEYLEAGTDDEHLINQNVAAFADIKFRPRFCKGVLEPDLRTTLFGREYSAPFGIAPIGLSGLVWPKAELYHAAAATRHNIPYSLSTVATETPETLAPHIGDNGWFQLYAPKDREVALDLLDRASTAGFNTLLFTIDVPVPSSRQRTARAGLTMPPKVTPGLIWDGATHLSWAMSTIKRGLPNLRTIAQYSQDNSIEKTSKFVGAQLGGTIDWEYIELVRDHWKGEVVVKGVMHPADAEKSLDIGVDGISVSNHGGRQFDGAYPSISALPEISEVVGGKVPVIFDGGVRTGLDVMRALSLGADFVLLGRAFMFGVAALGRYGSEHVIEVIKNEMIVNMHQLGVETVREVKEYRG